MASTKGSLETATQAALTSQQHPPDEAMKCIRTAQAGELFLAGQPIQAACCHLSIEDIHGALHKLWMGNELELNLALRLALNLDQDVEVEYQLSRKCEAAGKQLNPLSKHTQDIRFPVLNWCLKSRKTMICESTKFLMPSRFGVEAL